MTWNNYFVRFTLFTQHPLNRARAENFKRAFAEVTCSKFSQSFLAPMETAVVRGPRWIFR